MTIKLSKPNGLLFLAQSLIFSFMCFVRISEQTVTFALHDINRMVLYNRSGECLLRGTDSVLINKTFPILRVN